MRVKLFLCFTLILFYGRLRAQDYIIKQGSTKLLGEVTTYSRFMVKIQPDDMSTSVFWK